MSLRLALSLRRNKPGDYADYYGRFSYLLTTSNSYENGREGEMLKSYREIDDATALIHFTKKLNKYFFKRLHSKRHINVFVDEATFYDIQGKMIYFAVNYNVVKINNEVNEGSKLYDAYNVIVDLDESFSILNDVSYKTVDSKMFYSYA